jgi:hypothetical protein
MPNRDCKGAGNETPLPTAVRRMLTHGGSDAVGVFPVLASRTATPLPLAATAALQPSKPEVLMPKRDCKGAGNETPLPAAVRRMLTHGGSDAVSESRQIARLS